MKFYIQQEQESVLRPLETSEVKLSANKYCIIAHSSLQKGKRVDIRVIYRHPTYQKIYHDTAKVDQEGNLVVLPYTQMRPGKWEIYCHSDLMAEMVGEYWETCLFLEIEPAIVGFSPSQIVDDRETLETAQEIVDIQPEIDNLSKSDVTLTLDQGDILRQIGEALSISGCVEIKQGLGSHLCYELRHPLTEDLIYRKIRPLSSKCSIFAFQHALEIPEEWEIPLLTLQVKVVAKTGETLTAQILNIETEIPDLLEETTDYLNYTLELADSDTNIAYTFDIAIEKPLNTTPLLVNLPEPRKVTSTLRPLRSSSRSTLPPKLSSTQPKNPRPSLQLPNLPRPQSPPETLSALDLKDSFSSPLPNPAKSLK